MIERKLKELKQNILKKSKTDNALLNRSIAKYIILDFWKTIDDEEVQEYLGRDLLPDLARVFATEWVYEQFISDPKFRNWVIGGTQ